MSKSVSKNYIYNVSYQLLLLITPFITTPYLSRVLEPAGIGTYSYTYSIVSYFILLASLGVADYAQREIAYHQDSPHLQSRTFYEVNLIRFLLVGISLITYYFVVSHFSGDHLIYWYQALNIIAVLFDISWFFQGLEEFGKIVFRNFIIKLASIILIFALIHQPSDLNKYVALLGLMNIVSGLSIWLYLPKYLVHVPRREIHPFRNFTTILQMFLPQIAIQIYTVLDKTMIGVITGSPLENGYYEQAEKVVKMSLTVVTSLGTVMLPRIAYAYAHKEYETIKTNMMRSYRFVWFLTLPMFFGFIAVSSNFVPWFFGPGYEKVIPLMQILSGLVIAIGLSNVTGIQYLVPTGQQNKLTLSVVCGSATNFTLNALMIPRYGAIGAAVASLIAEMVVTLAQFYIVRDIFPLSQILLQTKNYLIAGLSMFVTLHFLDKLLSPSFMHTILIVPAGILLYTLALLIRHDPMLFFALNKIKAKIKRPRT
ncbi:flippase [Acidaminococcus provencensis]|uniref:flippase n=1 Tax=Acidaminococcus provencensis TaxID=2058289 RepID=UPI000CF8B97A|nr:flippase [Acidaminococcus provencensis]